MDTDGSGAQVAFWQRPRVRRFLVFIPIVFSAMLTVSGIVLVVSFPGRVSPPCLPK